MKSHSHLKIFLKSKGNLVSQTMIISFMAERGNLIVPEMLLRQICSYSKIVYTFFFFFAKRPLSNHFTTDTDSDA